MQNPNRGSGSISNDQVGGFEFTIIHNKHGGARGVMVIVAGCRHDDTSSNPGRAWLHFT